MKRHLSFSGVVLGILAATLAGCADEEGTNQPEQVKSSITSRGFVASGCTGTGVFDINSNSLIDFVAIDQSSFSKVSAELFALDKNNQEQLISTTQTSDAIDFSLATLLNEATNFTSAEQRATLLSEQMSSNHIEASSLNKSTSDSVASTKTTTSHFSDARSRQFTRTNASGFNDQKSSSDVNSFSNQESDVNSFNFAAAVARNALTSDATNFARSTQSADATQRARNIVNSDQRSGSTNDSFSDLNSNASNSALNIADQTRNITASSNVGGPKSFDFNNISNLDAFNRSFVFNKVRSDAFNSTRAAQNNSAFANLDDFSFSKVHSDADQTSFNKVANNSRNASRAVQFDVAKSRNQASNRSNVHNDANSHNSFDTSNFNEVITGATERLNTVDEATTINHLDNVNTARSVQDVNANSRNSSRTRADQTADSRNRSTSLSKQFSKQFQSLSNLSKFNASSLVLRVSVTANKQDSILSVFTGNNHNSVIANNDFAQTFAGCGVGAGISPKFGASITPKLTPLAAADVNEMAFEPLGDRVAKPE